MLKHCTGWVKRLNEPTKIHWVHRVMPLNWLTKKVSSKRVCKINLKLYLLISTLTPAALIWPLCGCRCFTLQLVKLWEGKITATICQRERGARLVRGTGAALYMDTVLTYVTVLCLVNTSAFQSCARKGHIVFELNSSVIFWGMI